MILQGTVAGGVAVVHGVVGVLEVDIMEGGMAMVEGEGVDVACPTVLRWRQQFVLSCGGG